MHDPPSRSIFTLLYVPPWQLVLVSPAQDIPGASAERDSCKLWEMKFRSTVVLLDSHSGRTEACEISIAPIL